MGGGHSGVLLERDGALSTLEATFGAVVAGRGGVALVSGDAGIGKSSLVQVFVAAEGRATRVLAGACDDVAVPRPLGPFLDMAGELPGLASELRSGGVDAGRVVLDESSRMRTGRMRRRSTRSRSSRGAWRPLRCCWWCRSATTRSGPTTRCPGRWRRCRPIGRTGSSWSA
jgi:AAA ATPase-like protein